MKKLIRIALVLMACVALTAVFGCKGKTTETGKAIAFAGYPMDAEGWNVSWFIAIGFLPNPVYASADQSPFHQWLQETLGVKIDWQVPIRGSESQALNLVLASGDLPDIIYGPTMNDAERYINEGTFRDLTPYMEQWSPAYYKWLKANPEYDRALKTDSGKYYGYGIFREGGAWNGTYLGPVVNKAWLDECNLPMPVTISDWDRTLRVFKERYGAVLSFAWSRAATEGTFISGAWGAYSFANYRLYIDKNRKIQIANIQPEYRDQLAKYAEWWRDGLLDQDFLSVTDTMARSNALNKKMGITVTSMGQLTNWRLDAKNQNTGADWVGLQYPTGDDGTLVQVSGGFGVERNASIITTACPDEKLELVMRMLDYAYTPEGFLFWNYGKKGVSWDYGPDGKPAFLPLVTQDPNGLNDAIDKYSGTVWSGSAIQATAMLYMKNSPEAIAANDLWYYPNEGITNADKLPAGMTFTAEESTRLRELGAISTYVNEAAIQFITGQMNFSDWDAYVARVNSLGAPEIIRIYQACYDRYMAR
jgi:putative aldouronate transport system substrate-binding protein